MKKLLFITLVTLLSACWSEQPKSEIENALTPIISEYPNYESNDMAREQAMSRVETWGKSLLGKAAPFNGSEFSFRKMETVDGHTAAFFVARGFVEIDAPKGSSNKYVISSPTVVVLAQIDNATAAKLDGNKKYSLSGTVKDWSAKDDFFIASGSMTPDDIFMGTFLMDNPTISEITE